MFIGGGLGVGACLCVCTLFGVFMVCVFGRPWLGVGFYFLALYAVGCLVQNVVHVRLGAYVGLGCCSLLLFWGFGWGVGGGVLEVLWGVKCVGVFVFGGGGDLLFCCVC